MHIHCAVKVPLSQLLTGGDALQLWDMSNPNGPCETPIWTSVHGDSMVELVAIFGSDIVSMTKCVDDHDALLLQH